MAYQKQILDIPNALSFLAGGGETGDIIRRYDWTKTPLGPPESWPQSLKTAVRIMLTSRQPIWIGWGDELIYLYNDAYQSIIGGKHPWAIGKPTRDVWSEVWARIDPLLATAMGGVEGTYVEEDLLIMERNGYPEETYYTYSYSPIPDDDGSPGGIICANTDDTQRVQAERQLALLRELASTTVGARTWHAACERSCLALATNPYDVTFALLYARPVGAERFELGGYVGLESFEEAELQSIHPEIDLQWQAHTALHERKPVLLRQLPRALQGLATGGAWAKRSHSAAVVPVLSQRDAGREGILVVGLSPHRLFDERYQEFVMQVAAQISVALDSADAYEQEKRRIEALDQLHRAKNTFFSNVSHEFRTPLTLMLGPLEDVLDQRASNEQTYNNVAVAHRNGLRLLRLVNSLLDFSRIEAGKVRGRYEPADLGSFTSDLASTFRSAVERAGLTLDITVRPFSKSIYIDKEMWEKIVLNLLSNAFKFTLEGGIRVVVESSDDNATAVVKVTDTGIGIPEEELPHLFERFHRVSGQNGRSIEGSGIGLALVNELVKLHGGSVHCESRLGVGTTMTISLPFGRAHLPPDQTHDLASSDAAAVTRAQEYVDEALRWTTALEAVPADPMLTESLPHVPYKAPEGRRKRILLADDNADMRDYIERLLADQWDIQTAPDGQAALECIRRQPPDLVLADVMMPRLDGFGLLQAIRSHEDSKEIPVIMLSARAGEEARVDGLDAGADDYLTKPFSARELLARVKSNLDLAQIRSDAKAAIREREERLRAALQASGTGTFRWYSESNVLEYDSAFAHLFDVAEESSVETLEALLAHIHVDDQVKVRDAYLRCTRAGLQLEEEFRVVLRNGSQRWLFAKAECVLDPHGRLTYLTGACVDTTERKNTQRQLEERTSQFATLLDRAPVGVYLVDGDFRIREVNPKAQPLFAGIPNLLGSDLRDVIRVLWPKDMADDVLGVFQHTLDTGEPHYEAERAGHRRDTGNTEYYEWLTCRIALPDNGHGVVCYFHDISATVAARQAMVRSEERLRDLNLDLENRVLDEVNRRARAEDALRHAQKMEAVGQLTGGIAHDFNNLLTVIIGGLEIIQRSRPDDTRRSMGLDLAFKGAQRAAELTSRLLAFSRRQPLQPRRLDINVLVSDMQSLLHRTLGEQIELDGVLAADVWHIEADKGQLENAIINLAVNARDAMPEGGKLSIETSNAIIDEFTAGKDVDVLPGEYVCVAVVDSGEGMTEDTQSRAFEPFFTTKEVGRGTGLGLSMIYGFVKQSGGHVSIRSELGKGTAVKLYFPRCASEAEFAMALPETVVPRSTRGEVVLVVEDNEDVRAYTVLTLTELGYDVRQACDYDSALTVLRGDDRIDLLFTDVVLPGKSGRTIADDATQLRPTLKTLFATGYSRDAIVHHGRLDAGVNLITKPYTFEQVALKLREVLDKREV